MNKVTIQFLKKDPDGSIMLDQRRVDARGMRFRNGMRIEIPYSPRPSKTVICTCDGEPVDALINALEYMLEFSRGDFFGWLEQSLREQGLEYIAAEIRNTLELQEEVEFFKIDRGQKDATT